MQSCKHDAFRFLSKSVRGLTGFDAIPQSKLELESLSLLFSTMRVRYAVIPASARSNPYIGYRKNPLFFEKRIYFVLVMYRR